MKKAYLITLDEDKVEELKAWLAKSGLTFSGYINSTIEEQINALRKFAPNGDYSKVTMRTLLSMASDMVKELKK